MATRNATTTGNWSAAGTWDTPPVDGDAVVIAAGVVLTCDVDLSAYATGIAGVTITGAAVTPARLTFPTTGGPYYLPIKAGTKIQGTNAAVLGQLYAGLAGSPVANSTKITIAMVGTATGGQIDGTYLDIQLYGTEPTRALTKLTEAAAAGAKILAVDAAVGADGVPWAAGDVVEVADSNGLDCERRLIELVGNLVANSGFETAGGGGSDIFGSWIEGVSDGAIADEMGSVHRGSHAAKLTAGTNRNTYLLQTVAVEESTNYRIKWWTKGDGSHDMRYGVSDATHGGSIIAATATGITAATWTEGYADFSTPAGCTSIYLYLYCPGTAAGYGYFDDLTIAPVAGGAAGQQLILTAALTNAKIVGARVVRINRNVQITSVGTQQVVLNGSGHVLGCAVYQNSASRQGTPLYNMSEVTVSGVVGGGLYGANQLTDSILSGIVVGPIYGLLSCDGMTMSGKLLGSTSGIYSCTGVRVSGTIAGCLNGAISSGKIYVKDGAKIVGNTNGIVKSSYMIHAGAQIGGSAAPDANAVDVAPYGAMLVGHGTSFRSSTQVSSYLKTSGGQRLGVSIYDLADSGGTPQPGRVKGWSEGGTTVSIEWANVPAGISTDCPITPDFLHKTTFELDGYSSLFGWPLLGKAGVPVHATITCRKQQTGETVAPHFDICDPQEGFEAAGEQLATVSMADSTDWQTLTLSYTPSYDKPLSFRASGQNGSGTMYYFWEIDPDYPAESDVWHDVDYANAIYTGSLHASDIANCEAANVKDGVTIDDVTGTYDPMAAAVFPATDAVDGGVSYGPVGTDYEGTGMNATTIRSALGLGSANLDTQLSAIKGDTASILIDTASILIDTGTDGVVIADEAISDASFSIPSLTAPATGILGFIVQTWRHFFKKATMTATEKKTYADDGTTAVTTQVMSNDGVTETQGDAS
jgi:hypothetical protein